LGSTVISGEVKNRKLEDEKTFTTLFGNQFFYNKTEAGCRAF